MFEIDPPADKASIRAALERLDGEISASFAALPVGEFLAPQGDAWSPGGHLVHLTKSVAAVARGMRMPRPVLAVLFGRARGGSASFEEIRERYLGALGGGLQAGGYGPGEPPAGLAAEELRGRVLGRWQRASGELRAALGRWSEEGLDRYRLPHPGLGKLTLREMLFFTLYHNAHHARRVRERAATTAPSR